MRINLSRLEEKGWTTTEHDVGGDRIVRIEKNYDEKAEEGFSTLAVAVAHLTSLPGGLVEMEVARMLERLEVWQLVQDNE